ncbi:MAG: hypothetical protein LKJ80_03260 [Oscillibacter sp.]|jgi:hypothetical protein|nr:hypothetical protein [Oscillibacter sp.]
MYNRYIRNDRGTYTRVPEEESRTASREHPPSGTERQAEPQSRSEPRSAPRPGRPPDDGLSDLFRRLLDRFHLENVDTGDLLLLLLLFLLFEEDADEELLFALGLLLIL